MSEPVVSEGERGLRVHTVQRAEQLAPEQLCAMQPASLVAGEIQPEGAPLCIGVAGSLAEDLELRFPFVATVTRAHRIGQRGIKGVALRDPEQLDRCIIDKVRQLLELVVEQMAANLQIELALDLRDDGQLAKDDRAHARRINEIRKGSKVKVQRIHSFKRGPPLTR